MAFLAFMVLIMSLFEVGLTQQMSCLGNLTVNLKEAHRTLYKGEQKFGLSMLRAIQEVTPSENIFFSPYSVYNALLLTYFGAKSVSEQELYTVLNLQWADNKELIRAAYKMEKNRIETQKSAINFANANRIFFEKSLKITSCLRDILSDEILSMDFKKNSEQSRLDINAWIAGITENEIPDMLTPGDVTTETDLILANAAYFKGDWASKFDLNETRQEVFYTSKSKTSFVAMMHKRGTYELTIDDGLGAHILQIPYVNNPDNSIKNQEDVSMIIILPPFVENGVENVLSKLTSQSLENALQQSMAREIDISLPAFEFEQRLELVPILKNAGVNSIFTSQADLTGFTVDRFIRFNDAKHVAKIKVNEEGSTAAAATVLFSFRSSRPVEPTKFECNHPFIFFIYDQSSQAILFSGIYRDPMTRK